MTIIRIEGWAKEEESFVGRAYFSDGINYPFRVYPVDGHVVLRRAGDGRMIRSKPREALVLAVAREGGPR